MFAEPGLYSRLQEWKAEQGIEKDSAAINQLLEEFFQWHNPTTLTREDIEELIAEECEIRTEEIKRSLGEKLPTKPQIDAKVDDYLDQKILLFSDQLAGIMARLDKIEDLVNKDGGVPTLFQEAALETVQMHVIEELKESPKLTQTELANRLKIHKSTISHRKEAEGFEEWSRRHDPEAIAWRYDRESKMFVNPSKNS